MEMSPDLKKKEKKEEKQKKMKKLMPCHTAAFCACKATKLDSLGNGFQLLG